MIYEPIISDPEGIVKKVNIKTREQVGHTYYRQSPSSRNLDHNNLRQSEDYESAKFVCESFSDAQTLAGKYHDLSEITKVVTEVKNGIKTITTTRNGETTVEVLPTEEEDSYTVSKEGTMVQTTLTSMNGGLWQLDIRVTSCYWDKEDETDDEEDDDEDSDAMKDEDGDAIPGNSREYPTVSVQCSMEEQSILNHEALRTLGSDEKSAVAALLAGSSIYDEIRVAKNKYRSIEKILDFTIDGIGNCLRFVQTNPTYSVPVIHITYRYKASNVPDMPEQGSVVRGTAMPGQIKQAEGYICVFVGCGYEYQKGAPVFYDPETATEEKKKYTIEENYVVFHGDENIYRKTGNR